MVALVNVSIAHAEDAASRLFADSRQQVYQVRVIDRGSGDKSSIGSGFLVSSEGHLATNFHVVASYVHEPGKYRLEYIAHNGSSGTLTLADFDVIHDLAIVMIDKTVTRYLEPGTRSLSKGDRIYSIGNPQDLGMTIIEGNFNGLVKESRYRKLLFSGSLNPGMSGGPALDSDGRIIGINVSKGGEQLSFLVPVDHLKDLLDDVRSNGHTSEYQSRIQSALMAEQDAFYGPLLQKEWDMDALGDVLLPTQLDESLKCWGHTVDEEDILYEGVHQHCKSQDVIYLDDNFQTGSFSYDFEWMSAGELNRFQFYNLLESRYTHKSLDNSYEKEHSTNFSCHTDFISIDEQPWRISSCTRAYRKYDGLYDILLLMGSVGKNDRGLIIRLGATGISRKNAAALLDKFTGSIEWTN